mgnify:CR=1 FL=1|jgi:DNA uptake protein and related DNA-binding proteins
MRIPLLGCVFFLAWLTPTQADSDLRTIPSARLVKTSWADGDSFLVRFTDPATGREREEVFRLYAVDCMETLSAQESDRRRLLEQARHFGVEQPALLIAEGRAATAFVQSRLARPFTLHTSFSQAPGRSGKPRYYAFVTLADGRDLAAELVLRGLARVKGICRETPTGVSRDEYAAHLADLELAAIRETPDPVRALDLNTATGEEIQSLPGIGPALAQRIVEGRPYQSAADLLRVRGIGKNTLEKLRPFIQTRPHDGPTRKKSQPGQLG